MSKKLEEMDGCLIREEFDWHEVVSGCEKANNYRVYRTKDGKKHGKKQFEYKEREGFCARWCLPGDCKSMNMKVMNKQYGKNAETEECMNVKRPCKCSFLCCNRQQMELMYTEKGQQLFLGKVYDPWDLCNYGFSIKDEDNKHLFDIKASCCQCAFWLCCTCDSCIKIEFKVTTKKHSMEMGSMIKTGKGCCTSPIDPKYNNFVVVYPRQANWKIKCLMTTCAVFIDYMMFKSGSTSKESSRR